MEEFKHDKPRHIEGPLHTGEPAPEHQVTLTIDGEPVGELRMRYYSRPMPLFYIEDILISEGKQGRGYGSKIMDFIEHMLRSKHKAGVLLDMISLDNPALGMYERRGWQRIPGSEHSYAYNLPKGADIADLTAYWNRIDRHWRNIG